MAGNAQEEGKLVEKQLTEERCAYLDFMIIHFSRCRLAPQVTSTVCRLAVSAAAVSAVTDVGPLLVRSLTLVLSMWSFMMTMMMMIVRRIKRRRGVIVIVLMMIVITVMMIATTVIMMIIIMIIIITLTGGGLRGGGV